MEAVLDDFTMDKNLLVHVIKSQAGTLTKAIVEAIMNSIDAGASRVDVTLDRDTFSVKDDGRGFKSIEEIREWFGRFGTPHKKDDCQYGQFRMGRGQCMSYGICLWSSNKYQMRVDIEKHGMKYALSEVQTPVPGCILSAELYRPLYSYNLEEVITELRDAVAWVSVPVFLNGFLISTTPQEKKDWTKEDDFAYYFIQPESQELVVYNQGVFVERMSSWKTGFGGIVVSKRRLSVNFARNAVMANDCPVWKQISANMETVVLGNLRGLKKLSDSERNYLAKRMTTLQDRGVNPLDVKVLTDASGKHLSPRELSRFKRFVCIPDDKSLAEAVHGTDGTYVLTSTTMNRFGVYDIYSFLDKMRAIPGAMPEYYEVIEPTQVASLGLAGTTVLKVDTLTAKERAAFRALSWLNVELESRLDSLGMSGGLRELQVGRHRAEKYLAWTDGRSYICANRKTLKEFSKGLPGVHSWLLILAHEMTHDTDDSESHDHGEVFYRKFHDTLMQEGTLRLSELAQAGLVQYLQALNAEGLSRPRELMRQLQPKLR